MFVLKCYFVTMLLCENERMRQCESVTSHIDMPLAASRFSSSVISSHRLPRLRLPLGGGGAEYETTASALNTRSRFSTFPIGTLGGGMLKDLPGLLAAAAFMSLCSSACSAASLPMVSLRSTALALYSLPDCAVM